MGEFVSAGYADRLDEDRIGFHIGDVTYEMPVFGIRQVLWNGIRQNAFIRQPQVRFNDDGRTDVPLMTAAVLTLSNTRRSVTFRPASGQLYIINADALRDVIRGKIPRATVSEVIRQPKKTPSGDQVPPLTA